MKCLISRVGAFGDMLIITPVLKRLKELGYEIVVHTGQRGIQILKYNPNVDRIIEHRDRVPIHVCV